MSDMIVLNESSEFIFNLFIDKRALCCGLFSVPDNDFLSSNQL